MSGERTMPPMEHLLRGMYAVMSDQRVDKITFDAPDPRQPSGRRLIATYTVWLREFAIGTPNYRDLPPTGQIQLKIHFKGGRVMDMREYLETEAANAALAGFDLRPGTIETIVEMFLDGVREGLRPPKRCFDIPGFGAFWRIGDSVSFVWDRDEWPTAGGRESDAVRLGCQEEDE